MSRRVKSKKIQPVNISVRQTGHKQANCTFQLAKNHTDRKKKKSWGKYSLGQNRGHVLFWTKMMDAPSWTTQIKPIKGILSRCMVFCEPGTLEFPRKLISCHIKQYYTISNQPCALRGAYETIQKVRSSINTPNEHNIFCLPSQMAVAEQL